MTNQEIIQTLQDFIQMEQKLSYLIQQKEGLEKEIRHYQIERKRPEPEHPSKIGTFFIDLVLSFFISFLLLYILSILIPGASNKLLIWLPLGMVVITSILTPIHYKRRDSENCARYVTACMRYDNWEKEKVTRMPSLQEQLEQNMNEGRDWTQQYLNAKLRNILHKDYLPYAQTILGYFQRGRARDLTEAVNLLEQELLEHRRDMETAEYRSEMREQAQIQTAAAMEAAAQGKQAAQAAEAAAFWSAAAYSSAARKNDSNEYRIV